LHDIFGRRSATTLGIPLVLASLVTGGCQTYRRAPLDLGAHQARWAHRSPSSHEVRELALRLAAATSVPSEFEPSDGLSLAEGEAVALVYNAGLRLARLEAAEAAASARHAGRWADPVFGFDGERILSDVANPWIAAASIGITLPFSGRLEGERRHASAEHRAAVADVLRDEWATRTRLRSRWLAWSFQSLRADLTRTLLDRLGGVAEIATRLEEAGELTRIEGRIFRAEQASRRIELTLLEARADELAIELKDVMGLLPGAPVDLVPQTGAGPAPISTEHDIGANPEMCAHRARYEIAEESLRLEIAKQYPDLRVGPGYRREDGNDRATLGLELPLPVWNLNRRGIAEARARRALAQAQFETAYERLASEAAAAEVRRAGAARRREEIESSLIPLIDEQAGEVQRVAELGQVNTLLMLDTLVRQHEAKLKLLDARLEEELATVRLQELAGPCAAPAEETP
jgi:outer membrane protein TolC